MVYLLDYRYLKKWNSVMHIRHFAVISIISNHIAGKEG